MQPEQTSKELPVSSIEIPKLPDSDPPVYLPCLNNGRQPSDRATGKRRLIFVLESAFALVEQHDAFQDDDDFVSETVIKSSPNKRARR